MSKAKLVPLVLLAVAQVTCEQPPLTAPPGSTLTVFANPPFIIANGGVSVISALVIEAAGTTVPDGTVVLFFTTLGQIAPEGETRAGVARVNLVSDTRSGTAQVTAVTGDQTATIEGGVAIGSALPALVVISADPVRITNPRRSTLIANVFDDNGNPVANVPVIFSLDGGGSGALTETLGSGGAQRFTDTNGQAFDTLHTRAPQDGIQREAVVTATTPNNVSASVTVFIN